MPSLLKRDPTLNLAERRQIFTPIIQFSRTPVGMVRHVLGGFERRRYAGKP